MDNGCFPKGLLLGAGRQPVPISSAGNSVHRLHFFSSYFLVAPALQHSSTWFRYSRGIFWWVRETVSQARWLHEPGRAVWVEHWHLVSCKAVWEKEENFSAMPWADARWACPLLPSNWELWRADHALGVESMESTAARCPEAKEMAERCCEH